MQPDDGEMNNFFVALVSYSPVPFVKFYPYDLTSSYHSRNTHQVGVADGVSQLEEFGIDASELPNELMRVCEEL